MYHFTLIELKLGQMAQVSDRAIHSKQKRTTNNSSGNA